VASNFFSSWDECPTNLWTLPTFSELANMSRDDLTTTVAAAATAQVKLCPYDEEEPHIWFHLIEAQFATAGIKSQKLKYANALASLPKQVHRDILDTLDVCNNLKKKYFTWTVWKQQMAILL
jgi:phenylalanine-4-hydroxylase